MGNAVKIIEVDTGEDATDPVVTEIKEVKDVMAQDVNEIKISLIMVITKDTNFPGIAMVMHIRQQRKEMVMLTSLPVVMVMHIRLPMGTVMQVVATDKIVDLVQNVK